jgi:acetylglutamate kinase
MSQRVQVCVEADEPAASSEVGSEAAARGASWQGRCPVAAWGEVAAWAEATGTLPAPQATGAAGMTDQAHARQGRRASIKQISQVRRMLSVYAQARGVGAMPKALQGRATVMRCALRASRMSASPSALLRPHMTASTTPAQPDAVAHIAPRDKAEILAQALPYIRKFHGKTIVIKYGGNAMTDPELQADFAEDVVLLKLVGLNPVVVHGGGPQIDSALNKIGKKGQFIQGMRVTDEETMEVVEWVLAGEVQQDIVGLINAAGGKAVGLTGRDGGLIRARKLKLLDLNDPAKEHDVGQVGEIESIDPSVVKALQDDQFIPVISPIGFGSKNESYNINADLVASKLAQVLKAEKLMLLTNIKGVLNKEGELITDLTARDIDDLIEDGTISGGMIPKIEGAIDAAKSGVHAVHIVDGRVPHAMLLEILTDQAYGTMIRSH